jgi:hypothetical protein
MQNTITRWLTLVLFHTSTLETLVKQTNAQSYIDAHALLIDHARDAVLNQDIGTVGTELVATIRDLLAILAHAPSSVPVKVRLQPTLEITLLYHFLCA